jgi:rSAM/selenodomain-associated transferase 2
MKFSVIIPALNEGERIGGLVLGLKKQSEDIEVIVVDGGSQDETREEAIAAGATVLDSERGRGNQCNAGAMVATGDILLFLHADTSLPQDSFKKLETFFSVPSHNIGTFKISFKPVNWLLDFISWFSNFDTIFTRFGDQCIVLRRRLLEAIGGFPDWPLFEDLRLLQKARRVTKIHSLPGSVETSSRRFLENGVVRQLLWNAWLITLYLLGKSPERLAAMY